MTRLFVKRREFLAAAFFVASGVARGASGKRDVFKVGIDAAYAPYSYTDESRQLVGIDIELAREAGRRLGVDVEFVPVIWDRKDAYLADGRADCIWSCFTVTGRESKYHWVPYLLSRQVVVVQDDSPVQFVKDLEGKVVAVQSSTRPESFLLSDGEGAPNVASVASFPTMIEAFMALRRHFVDAMAGHEAVLQRVLAEVPGNCRILKEPLLAVKVGVAFPLNTKKMTLVRRLDKVMKAMTVDGFVARTAKKYGLAGDHITLTSEELS